MHVSGGAIDLRRLRSVGNERSVRTRELLTEGFGSVLEIGDGFGGLRQMPMDRRGNLVSRNGSRKAIQRGSRNARRLRRVIGLLERRVRPIATVANEFRGWSAGLSEGHVVSLPKILPIAVR